MSWPARNDSVEKKPAALKRPDSTMGMTDPIWNKGMAHSVSKIKIQEAE